MKDADRQLIEMLKCHMNNTSLMQAFFQPFVKLFRPIDSNEIIVMKIIIYNVAQRM